ncbi:MAG: hypothetical protein ABSH08_00530 [Tepidisphaeraceae bacterium]
MTETDSTALTSAGHSEGHALAVAGWAIYLAMSWTWCIGMFLPVLLMRELGIGGVITFAIPNIVGAAAMGWVIRDANQSRRIIGEHRPALVWYSLITIVYHAFFAAWLIRRIAGPNAGAAVAATFLVFWLILHWKNGGQFLAASLALAVSLAAIAWGFWRGDLPYLAHPVEAARLDPINNLWLTPAWMLGFLCCPYLDLTFHAARQALSRTPARAAFTFGFAIIFPLMLAITVAYSGWLAVGFDRARYPQLALILCAHLIVQSCLTVALHVRQIPRVQQRASIRQFLAFMTILILAVLLGVLDRPQFRYNGLDLGEIIYRVFLGFYGLVFPVYVWLRMCQPRRSLLRVGTVILIAAPLYWLAFADERMGFIVPGVLIVVLAKFLPDAAKKPA